MFCWGKFVLPRIRHFVKQSENPEFSLSTLSSILRSDLKAFFFCNSCLISFLSCVLIFSTSGAGVGGCGRGLGCALFIFLLSARMAALSSWNFSSSQSTRLNSLSEIVLSLRAFETNSQTVFFLVMASV